MAQVGGMMQIIVALFYIFIAPFIDISYKVAYINELIENVNEDDYFLDDKPPGERKPGGGGGGGEKNNLIRRKYTHSISRE